jgi:hypothetical protein
MINDMHAVASMFPSGTDTTLEDFEKSLDKKLSDAQEKPEDTTDADVQKVRDQIADFKKKLKALKLKGVIRITNDGGKFTITFDREDEEPVSAGTSVSHETIVRFRFEKGAPRSKLTNVQGVYGAFAGMRMAKVESVVLTQQPGGEVLAEATVRMGFLTFNMPTVTLRQDGTLKL